MEQNSPGFGKNLYEYKMIDLIITTFNDRNRIKKCLDSIPKSKNLNVIIVDDNSKDNTVGFIKNNYPEFKILVPGKGPAKNRNIAIKETKEKYIVTMDSDAELKNNWIKKAVNFMEENPGVGICGGKLLINEKKLASAGGVMSKRGNGYDIGHGDNPNKEEYNKLKKVIYTTTATAIIRRKMLNEIGLFDEDYGHGFEDTDLGLRANIFGWDVIYNPELISYHYADYSDSSKSKIDKKTNYYLKKNKITTVLKNFQFLTLIKYSPLLILNFLFNLLLQKNKKSTILAYLWNIKNIKKIIKKREKIKNLRKISDKKLFKKVNFKL